MPINVVALLFGLSSCITSSLAGLKFDETTVKLSRTLQDKEATVRFDALNGGTVPVDIITVVSSCGCADFKASKSTVQPGDKVSIVGTIKFSGVLSQETKKIAVKTNEATGGETVLSMVIAEPTVLALRPAVSAWSVGQAPQIKEIVVEVLPNDMRIALISAHAVDSADVAEITTIEDGKKYMLRVLTTDTQKIRKVNVRIQTNLMIDGKIKELPVQLEVNGGPKL